MKLTVALTVCRAKYHMARKWLTWARTLAEHGAEGHKYDLLVWCAKAISPSDQAQLFAIVSDCPGITAELQCTPLDIRATHPYAEGNYLALSLFVYCEEKRPGRPTLLCEEDTVQMRPSWASDIEAEYNQCGKPFMGDHEIYRPPVAGIDHMTGNAVYSPDWRALAPSLLTIDTYEPTWGFDSKCAHQTFVQSHRAKSIQQIFAPPLPLTEDYARAHIHEAAALFHRCRDSSLIDALAKRYGYPAIPTFDPLH